jgi:mRNA (2'-O-methyladenosine-N6-)-methyltransferase
MTALVEHRNYLSDVLARQAARRRLADPEHDYAPLPTLAHDRRAIPRDYASSSHAGPSKTAKGKAASAPKKDNVVNYIAAEEALRNDYAAWYGVSGQFPSNYVLGAGDDEICGE